MGPKTVALMTRCQDLGLKYVGFRGNPKAPVWQLGEAPGGNEEQLGYPFVGASGHYIDSFMQEVGFDKADICFTNPYKVRPPGNKLSELPKRGIPLEVYEEAFFEELREYKPTFIVCNGATPLGVLCPETKESKGKPPLITKWRGSLLTSSKLDWPHYIIPNVHPAFVIRNYAERDTCVFVHRKVMEEFIFWKLAKFLRPLPSRQLITDPSPDLAFDYLRSCLTAAHVSSDLELLGRRVPFVIGLSYDRSHAISLELFKEGSGWTTEKLRKVWRLIDEIHKKKSIVGQNYAEFDANWMDALGFHSGIQYLHDTRIRHHVLWPDLSHSLQFMTMQYTREPYYKDEGRGWHLGRALTQLKRYNCKDAAVTLEVFEQQDEEFQAEPEKWKFYLDYEMPLARTLHETDKRGIYTNELLRRMIRTEVIDELQLLCDEISRLTGTKVVRRKEDVKNGEVNLASPIQLKKLLHNIGIALPKDRITHKETTNEEALNKAFAETGHPVLKHQLRIRELNKMLGTYIDAKLLRNTFYFQSSVAGTGGGRRSSRKNFLGYGSNAQNQPKHSDIGLKFREVFIAHPGNIFIACDQKQAEDWIVQGIIADVSGRTFGYDELMAGIDRHRRLASQIFNMDIKDVAKDSMERYLGKKVRHAANYNMQADTMSAEMAKEGRIFSRNDCQNILNLFHHYEPDIRGVYHPWVIDQLNTTRTLTTPLGRSRFYFGLHPTRNNSKIYREGFSYIPQSTVGDNTGLAILYLEKNFPGHFLSEVHDSCLLEIKADADSIWEAFNHLKQAFHRTLRFPNGFELEIPIEFELGFDLQRMNKCPDNVDLDGLRSMLNDLKTSQVARSIITIGQH